MAFSSWSGPIVNAGGMYAGQPGSFPREYNLDATSILSFRGYGILDTRYTPLPKDNALIGSIEALFSAPVVYSVNKVPNTISASNIASVASTTNGTALTLAGATAGISTNVPYLSFPTQQTVINGAIAIDFGFDYANTTAGSVTITVADSTLYFIGMPLVIANVGNAGGTSALLTTVASVPSSTTITVNNAPLATNSAAPIGTGNNWQGLSGLNNITPIASYPYFANGVGAFYDATQGISRGISITGVSGGAGGVFLVSGADIYGNTQTESITVAAGVNTVNSKKTYKFINSITPQFSDAHAYTVGTADLYGFALRCDQWENISIYWNSTLITSSTGFTAADTTSPATTTTKDVRGTYATQSASDGTKKLVIIQYPPAKNVLRSGVDSPQWLYGVTPV
jgi:hypothetical protein